MGLAKAWAASSAGSCGGSPRGRGPVEGLDPVRWERGVLAAEDCQHRTAEGGQLGGVEDRLAVVHHHRVDPVDGDGPAQGPAAAEAPPEDPHATRPDPRVAAEVAVGGDEDRPGPSPVHRAASFRAPLGSSPPCRRRGPPPGRRSPGPPGGGPVLHVAVQAPPLVDHDHRGHRRLAALGQRQVGAAPGEAEVPAVYLRGRPLGVVVQRLEAGVGHPAVTGSAAAWARAPAGEAEGDPGEKGQPPAGTVAKQRGHGRLQGGRFRPAAAPAGSLAGVPRRRAPPRRTSTRGCRRSARPPPAA